MLTFVLTQAAKNLEKPDFQTYNSMFLVTLRGIMSQNNLYALHCHTFFRLRTPLHNSAYYHNVETCRFLVESKADVAATCR